MEKKWKGYFTVEASLIFPFILLIQIMMIYLAFFHYDRFVLEGCAFEAAFRGSNILLHDNQKAYEASKDTLQNALKGRLFSTDGETWQIKVSDHEIKVICKCHFRTPFLTWMSEISKVRFDFITVVKTVPRINPVRIIRMQEFGKELVQNGYEK